MNTFWLILVLGLYGCSLAQSRSLPANAIREDEEEHRISKRSASADHSITDAKSRHIAQLQRQLLLKKLLNSVDTSTSETPYEIMLSRENRKKTTLTTTGRPTAGPRGHGNKRRMRHHRRRNNARKGGKRNRGNEKLAKSIEILLQSDYADEIIDAISNIVPSKGGIRVAAEKTASAARKFARKCSCDNQDLAR